MQHLHPIPDQGDEGQEQLPVQPVLVEILGHPVRGRDHHHATVEQHLEQPPDDHRVGDVGDLHLVEAEQPRAGGDGLGHGAHDVLVAAGAGLVQTGLHLLHELVEMDAALLGKGSRLHHQVHQHRLAATDAAPQVDAPA